jgi:hypothetical protein
MWKENTQNSLSLDHGVGMTCITYLIPGSHDRRLTEIIFRTEIIPVMSVTYSYGKRHSWRQVLWEATRNKQIFSTLPITANRKYYGLLMQTSVRHEMKCHTYDTRIFMKKRYEIFPGTSTRLTNGEERRHKFNRDYSPKKLVRSVSFN